MNLSIWKLPILKYLCSYFVPIENDLSGQILPGFLLSLRWRHHGRDGVSNHQPHDCLLNRLFRRRSKKTSKLRVTGLCVGNSPVPVNSPHEWPVTRKMSQFDDVIMYSAHETVPKETSKYDSAENVEYSASYVSNSCEALYQRDWHNYR